MDGSDATVQTFARSAIGCSISLRNCFIQGDHHMKKIVLFAALAAASLTVSACGKKAEEAPVAVDTATAAAVDATTAASDGAEDASSAKM